MGAAGLGALRPVQAHLGDEFLEVQLLKNLPEQDGVHRLFQGFLGGKVHRGVAADGA